MLKGALCSALVLAALQDTGANPDLLYKKEVGVSIMKPPKNEEWGFPEKGFWTNSQLVVAHKVDTLRIEISYQEKPSTGYFDPKKAAEGEWTNLSGNANFKEARKNQEIKSMKLPGGGAGNVNAHVLDMWFKVNDKPTELKMYCFIGRENQGLYKITLSGDEGMYKKHQKWADYILSTIKTWKLPK